MNAIISLIACATLVSAGGIGSYSIAEDQIDRSVRVNRGPVLGYGLGINGLGVNGLGLGINGLGVNGLGLGINGLGVNGLGLGVNRLGLGVNGLGLGYGLAAPSLLSAPLISSGLPLLSSRTLIGGPAISTLSAPLGIAEPTIIRQSVPLIGSKTLIRSEPLIGRSLLSAPLLSSGLIGGEPLLLGGRGLGLGLGSGLLIKK